MTTNQLPRVIRWGMLCLYVVWGSLSASAATTESRVWTLADGRSIEGTFISVVGSSYVIKTSAGKQVKIPARQLCDADRLYVELSRPPSLEIDFVKNLSTVTFSEGYYGSYPRYPEQHGNFGFRIKQTSSGAYAHTLRAELFVVAQQLGVTDKKCFIIDRQAVEFAFPERGQRIFEFMSTRQVRLENWQFEYRDCRIVEHGEIYYGYLIMITDQRGEVIAKQASKVWFAEVSENLSQLKVGNYFDQRGKRCFPGRPEPLRW